MGQDSVQPGSVAKRISKLEVNISLLLMSYRNERGRGVAQWVKCLLDLNLGPQYHITYRCGSAHF